MTAYIRRRGGVDMDGVIATGLTLREAWSMKFESLTVLDMLQYLEQQVGEYHRHAAQVAAALGGGHLALARDATNALRQVLDTIVELAASLQTRVVPADGIGETMESLAELAIRARRVV